MERSLDQYRSYVQQIAHERPSSVILNRSPEHASIIFEQLFLRAEYKVCILTGALNSKVYGESSVLNAIEAFLRRSPQARLEIVSEEPIPTNHPVLSRLQAAGLNAQASLSTLTKQIADQTPLHFAVVDGQHFRMESDKTKFEALVQFGNPALGSDMQRLFEDLKRTCAQQQQRILEPA
jgi:hypothetical protein